MSGSSTRGKKPAKAKEQKSEAKIEEEPAPPVQMPAVHPQRKQVAVLGTTPSRMEGPINEPDWEIWTIGPGGKDVHRWDRLFEIHGIWPLEFGEQENGKSYLNDLSLIEPPQYVYSTVPMTVAMARWARDADKSEEWLRETITGSWAGNVVINTDLLFERFGKTWFSSSISYAMALAVEEGYTDIAVFGIDLESGEEYVSQFPGCRFFIDLARYLGINIHLPKGCGLMREPMPYPDRYETHQALMLERKVKWLEAMLGEHTPQFEENRMMSHRVEGALLKIRQIEGMLINGEEITTEKVAADIKSGEEELAKYARQEGQMQANMNHIRGELSGLRFCQRMWTFGIIDPAFDLKVGPEP